MKINKTKIRDLIYNILGTFDNIFGRQTQHVVLCYHSINNDNDRFSVNYEVFIEQINLLLKTRKNISVEEFEKIVSGEDKTKQKTFLLTFDDGYKNLLNIREFVNSKRIKPLIFVLPFDSNPDYNELGLKFERLNEQDTKSLISDGWGVGSHSFTHSDLNTLSTQELKHEIIDSKDSLERYLGNSISYFAYPKGRYSKNCESLAKDAGYKLVFTMNDGRISTKTNALRIPRIGVDRTHSLSAFTNTIKPSNILFRQIVKSLGISGL